jgi:hypothetical protein
VWIKALPSAPVPSETAPLGESKHQKHNRITTKGSCYAPSYSHRIRIRRFELDAGDGRKRICRFGSDRHLDQ